MARTGPVTKDTSSVALGQPQIRVGSSAANISNSSSVLTSNDSIGAVSETKFTGTVEYWKMESGYPLMEDVSLPIRETASFSCSFKEITSKNLALSRGLDPSDDVSATVTQGTIKSVSGTTTGDITVNDDGGVVDDTFIVVFTGPTAGNIYGQSTGLVHSFTALDAAMSPTNSTDPYFTIPASFFSGTWADGETFTFKTTEYIAGTSVYGDSHSGEIKLGGIKAPAYIRMEAVYTYPNGTNHMYIIFPRSNVTSSADLSFSQEDAAASPITFESKRADSEVSGGNMVWDDMPLGRIYFD